ncbi:DUF58 domain-containing protein [Ferrimicrobium sp.]|uniref:DUF58 domain-containing protein n=1 Tax=Ferrimicrobium sp. TaxID=2926050 RepID=UPI002611E7A8|nr:DUF58 domain-containing protein [Ferrimicrobium sp.]
MQRRYTARFALLLLVTWVTLILAAIDGPVIIAIGTPLILLVAIGLLWPRTPFGAVRLEACGSGICFEGDSVTFRISIEELRSQRYRIQIRSGDQLFGDANVTSDSTMITVTFPRFGDHHLDASTLVREGPFGLFEDVLHPEITDSIKVFPAIEEISPLSRAVDAQFAIGRHRSTMKTHAGLEFVDVRQAGPGDVLADVNWKATARTGTVWLNQRSSELPLDLVIFLDSFSPMQLANLTKIASNLARVHLRNYDRVGLVVFGGTIGWIPPASGRYQERLIAERLLLVRPYATAADKRIDLLPRNAIPRSAAIVVLSALQDRRMVQAVRDLRLAGHPLTVVGPLGAQTTDGNDAQRLGALMRRQLLEDIARLGVTVVNSENPTLSPTFGPSPRVG